MARIFRHFSAFLFILGLCVSALAQEVPYGINYQAVARDSYGEEITSSDIDIRFTVLSSSTDGTIEYQEIHNNVRTSVYGVFSVTIGKGTPTMGACESFSAIRWDQAPHYLKVEIKFTNEFLEMNPVEFLSVPYALYAAKSLEPGPPGPKGDPGDPATDDQKLSFDGENLTIDGGSDGGSGNTVNLSALLNVDDADANPLNEIQDLRIENDILSITVNAEATPINLTKYLDNTDEQDLSFNASDSTISITGGNTADLSSVLRDADTNPSNELITGLSIDGTELVINEGSNESRVDLGSNVIAFRALKTTSITGLSYMTDYDFAPNMVDYNEGSAYNSTNGEFTAPLNGIYTFSVGFGASGSGDSRKLLFYIDRGSGYELYETLQTHIDSQSSLLRSITLKLEVGDAVKVVINTGTSNESGTGSFSGYKVY